MTCGAAGASNGPLRQKVLPVVYGLATSMSCVLFATGAQAQQRCIASVSGSASNDMSWVTAGVLLLVVSVLCAWDVLWCFGHEPGHLGSALSRIGHGPASHPEPRSV